MPEYDRIAWFCYELRSDDMIYERWGYDAYRYIDSGR